MKCPKCDTEMTTRIDHDTSVTIDKCPFCRGVFLDGGELETIKRRMEEEGESSGHGGGFGTGLALGLCF